MSCNAAMSKDLRQFEIREQRRSQTHSTRSMRLTNLSNGYQRCVHLLCFLLLHSKHYFNVATPEKKGKQSQIFHFFLFHLKLVEENQEKGSL